MNAGFKLTVFSLIVIFAVAVSQMSVGMSRRGSSVGVARSGSAGVARGVSGSAGRAMTPRSSAQTPGGVTRTTAPGVVATIQVSKVRGQKLLPAPRADSSYSLGYLFDLINTNNTAKTSNFQVFVPGNPPSSKSAEYFGLTKTWIEANRNVMVTLKMDDTGIIQIMESMGSFPKSSDITQAKAYGWDVVFQYTIDNFKKILLYFQVPGFDQKFYIIDVWSQTSPIKWNVNYAPEQVCRPYRLLMDWTFE